MRRVALLLLTMLATSALAQDIARVAEDAIVIDRVAEASKRDLPSDLLKRIVNEDIDILRGKRTDGTYQYASYERLEASRTTSSFSIQDRADKMQTVELRGTFIYRIVVDVPQRRLLVRKNRPIWIERVDVEYVSQTSSLNERQSFEVKAWLQPGNVRPIELPVVARQATVRVIATAEEKGGYGNLDVALVHAKIVDNPDSPYVDAVAAAKAILRALDNNDIPSMRVMAQRLRGSLGGAPRVAAATTSTPPPPPPSSSTSTMTVTAPRDAATELELQTELQLIEDLLTGNETERREGLDRLHQLIRRLRR